MHAPSEEAEPSTTRKRSRRLFPRRWYTRTLALVALVLLVAIVVTQIVLWTNVPRDLVLDKLQKQLGLRVTAESLSTGWLGNTELRDVTIALPLADESLLRVRSMRVKHTTLLGMLWTSAVELDEIALQDPELTVRQDAAGRWNVQEVAELLFRTGGKEPTAQQARTSSRPTLPAVRVVNGKLHVVDRGGRATTIAPVNVTGDPENPVTWTYHADAGGAMRLTGRLSPGGKWLHELKVDAQNVQTWAYPWVGSDAPVVAFDGEWRGEMQGGLVGRMVVNGLRVGDMSATGAFGARTESGGITLRPQNLLVHTAQNAMPELRVAAGKLFLDGKSVVAEALTVLSFGGAARVDGQYDWAGGSADLKATWSDFAVPDQKISHGGTLTASLRTPLPGRRVGTANLVSAGNMPGGSWEADLLLGGAGQSPTNMDWELTARRLSVAGRWAAKLDGLAATMQARGSLITLTSLRGPGEIVARGSGQFDRSTRDWRLRVELSNIPRPVAMGTQSPLAITLNADGNAQLASLHDPGLSVRGQDIELRVDGSYVYDIPKPVALTVHVNSIQRGPMLVATSGPTTQPTRGLYLRGKSELTGTAWPLDLAFTGDLTGREVPVFGYSIGDVEANLTGRIDEQGVALQTQRLELLGGKWRLDALQPRDGALGVNLAVEKLSLEGVGAAIKQPGMRGSVDARWAIFVPKLAPEAISATGLITARDVAIGKLVADQATATLVLSNGKLRVEPVQLQKGEGRASAAAETDVNEIRRLAASLELTAWPFEFKPGTKAELWGGTRGLRITFPGATREEGIRRGVFQPETKATRLWVRGPIDVSAALRLKDQSAGDARVVADLRGNVLDLRSISFDGLDGTVQGQGMIDFDRPFATRGHLLFENFNGERITDFFPGNELLKGFGGRFSGNARIEPTPGPRPLMPLRVTANVRSDGGRYRTIEVGPAIQLSAFTNLDRVVIEDSVQNPTTVGLAGGLVRVWGRFSMLEPGDELNPATTERALLVSQVQVKAQRLDLDQIVHAFKPDADAMPGKLSVSFDAFAGTRPDRRAGETPSGQGAVEKVVRRITGDGRVELTDSELTNLDVIGALYDAMSISGSNGVPQGKGEMSFHLEDGRLALNNVRYFNRGTEIRAIVDVDAVWRMPASPISGTAVGSCPRPFRDVKLPFLSTFDLDTVLTVLQTNVTTMGLRGTVRDPEPYALAFSELGQGMRMFILGDLESETKKAKEQRKGR